MAQPERRAELRVSPAEKQQIAASVRIKQTHYQPVVQHGSGAIPAAAEGVLGVPSARQSSGGNTPEQASRLMARLLCQLWYGSTI
jgi:hypothetical protein